MGQSKGSAYQQTPALTPQQTTLLNHILSQSAPSISPALEAFNQFLPGGGGGEAFKQQAMKDYQQRTIPSILNAFGTGSKGSSSLNQALASSAENLNTNLASQLALLQLQAAEGPFKFGALGLGTPAFAFEQRPGSWVSRILKGAVQGGAAGAPAGPWGATIGSVLGGTGGAFG